jgi:hypothetical protein
MNHSILFPFPTFSSLFPLNISCHFPITAFISHFIIFLSEFKHGWAGEWANCNENRWTISFHSMTDVHFLICYWN